MARGLYVFEVDIRTHYFNKLWLLRSCIDCGVCGGWLLHTIADRLFLHYFSPFINPHCVRLDSVWPRNTVSAFPMRSAVFRQKKFTKLSNFFREWGGGSFYLFCPPMIRTCDEARKRPGSGEMGARTSMTNVWTDRHIESSPWWTFLRGDKYLATSWREVISQKASFEISSASPDWRDLWQKSTVTHVRFGREAQSGARWRVV